MSKIDLPQSLLVALTLGAASSACASPAMEANQFDPVSAMAEGVSEPACEPSIAPNPLGLPTACFPDEARAEMTGKVLVETPPLHELFLILTSLTQDGRASDTRLVRQASPYAERVRQHFGNSASHEAVAAVQALLSAGIPNHIAAKVDASAYVIDQDGAFAKRPEYTWIRGSEDHLEPVLALLQDFADDTQFASFFRSEASQSLYARQQSFFRDEAQVDQLLAWLNRQYPDTQPFESVRLIVSPLAFGYQHQDGVADGDFRQLIAHINFPEMPETADGLSASALAFSRTAILFTELNHGFIEPRASDVLERIELVFDGGQRFVDLDKVSSAYRSSKRVFLEYLNWALISVYACEHFSEDDCTAIASRVARTMVDERGFSEFEAFQDWLISERSRGAGSKLQELTPVTIDWFEQRGQL